MDKHIYYELRELNPDDKSDRAAAARLHEQLLGWGPIAMLGHRFLENFVYKSLIRDKLVKAVLCLVDGRPAGFIVFTANSITFHRKAVKDRWLFVAKEIFVSVMHNPRILLKLPKALHLMYSRRQEEKFEEDPSAEILAIGVIPEYRNFRFIHRTGIKIAEDLLKQAASYFKSLGLNRMRAVVDDFNKPALLFYHSLGGDYKLCQRAGDSMFQFWIDLDRINL